MTEDTPEAQPLPLAIPLAPVVLVEDSAIFTVLSMICLEERVHLRWMLSAPVGFGTHPVPTSCRSIAPVHPTTSLTP
jgi:hypothetical protein